MLKVKEKEKEKRTEELKLMRIKCFNQMRLADRALRRINERRRGESNAEWSAARANPKPTMRASHRFGCLSVLPRIRARPRFVGY